MNPNHNREIASLQAKWLIELKKPIVRQSAATANSLELATSVSAASPGSNAASRGSTSPDITEFDSPGMNLTTETSPATIHENQQWCAGPLDYPTLACEPRYLVERLVCPIIPKYTLTQWMLDKMAVRARSITKTPPNPPKLTRGGKFPAPLQGSDYSPPPRHFILPEELKFPMEDPVTPMHDDGIPAVPFHYDEVPTAPLFHGDIPTIPVSYDDIPTIPVDHDDIPTLPAAEATISPGPVRRHFPSTAGKELQIRSESTTKATRKRKRAHPGALEKAATKVSATKRRKREGGVDRDPSYSGDGGEKENARLKRLRLSKLAKNKV